MRLSSCLGFVLHIIRPTGFLLSDRHFRRASLDYAASANVVEHDSFDLFHDWCRQNRRRLVLLTTKAAASGYGIAFRPDDVLMVGRETSGVPPEVAASADAAVRIPMRPEARSINVAIAAAMMLAEAYRQTGRFEELA